MKRNLENKADSTLLDIETHPVMNWITAHGMSLLSAVLATFLTLFVLYFWLAGGASKSEADYRYAEQQFQWLATENVSPQDQEKVLSKLTSLLDRYPELHSKYDGQIAQILINEGKAESAIPFATSTFARIRSDNLSFYVQYSEITLLIAQKQYDEALKRSVALKEAIIKDIASNDKKAVGGNLFAFNLLRIAFLQQKAGTKEQEIATWKEWQQYVNQAAPIDAPFSIDKKALFSVAQLFNIGSLTLDQYIAQRLKSLSI